MKVTDRLRSKPRPQTPFWWYVFLLIPFCSVTLAFLLALEQPPDKTMMLTVGIGVAFIAICVLYDPFRRIGIALAETKLIESLPGIECKIGMKRRLPIWITSHWTQKGTKPDEIHFDESGLWIGIAGTRPGLNPYLFVSYRAMTGLTSEPWVRFLSQENGRIIYITDQSTGFTFRIASSGENYLTFVRLLKMKGVALPSDIINDVPRESDIFNTEDFSTNYPQ